MMNFKLFSLIMILLLPAFFSFGNAQAKEQSGSNNNNNGNYDDWQFRQETVATRGVVDGDVFTIDAPEGWDFDAEVDWLQSDLPAFTIYLAMNDAPGTSLVGVLPMTSYVWFTDPLLQQYMPEGSVYSGDTTVLEPRDPDQYLEELLIPYLEDIYRDQARIRNFEIVDIEDRNDLADDYLRMIGVEEFGEYYDCTAAVAHVAYNQDGTDVVEDVSAIIGVHEASIIGVSTYSMENVYYWSMLVSVVKRAPVGELNYMDGLYDRILGSIQMDQDFLDDYWDEHQDALEHLQQRQDEQFQRWEQSYLDE
jgi:hypothetical protein